MLPEVAVTGMVYAPGFGEPLGKANITEVVLPPEETLKLEAVKPAQKPVGGAAVNVTVPLNPPILETVSTESLLLFGVVSIVPEADRPKSNTRTGMVIE